MNADIIKELIESGLPDADVTVEGDDGQHFKAYIISESFFGKSPIQQHKMVYKALGDSMGKEIHALSFKTAIPEDLKKNKLS
ncbi:MAG: BolA family transcriptional regulator [Legionellales bacterium]|nr:BolA family transcriptional regulator [Legionellales bacterium]|tara:strand:- start:334 stop:579 length:246 start_codon:yes stop_codon:yes gene_type:complete